MTMAGFVEKSVKRLSDVGRDLERGGEKIDTAFELDGRHVSGRRRVVAAVEDPGQSAPM